jgi:dUTP pyrophosphatase
MNTLRFKKLHPDSKAPTVAHAGDAGSDLYVHSVSTQGNADVAGATLVTYGTGVAVEIPDGYVGLCVPRSSVYKTRQILSNCCGIIDSGYRGEIQFKYYATTPDDARYAAGERCGQLVIVPCLAVQWEESDALTETERGEGGYGSTGK